MTKYDHRAIERKWQERWEREKFGVAKDAPTTPPFGHPSSKRRGLDKSYVLVEFPYPSGDGLHVGHVRSYAALDAVARKRRMEGKNVLFPVGWDAFGLPTENYALKTGVHPREATDKNIANFRRQMKSLGLSFDWSREVDTTDPTYYKWTQWIFLRLLKAGLAYQATIPISWCPKDKIGLANEEVVNGKCERCGTTVERRMQKQWMLKITAYADRLLKDLDTVDYPDRIKTQQQNWIGRSEGATVKFQISNSKFQIEVFTTRPDTLFGATYLVLSPEHPLVDEITTKEQKKAVEKYRKQVANKSDLERTSLEKEKTGVFTGAYAENPINKSQIPIWTADYVLMSYGTGAIMAVPAHDERDHAFAKKYELPIREVVVPEFEDEGSKRQHGKPAVVRKTVYALLRNPKDDTYLCLDWNGFYWNTVVIGGIEDGDDPVTAAKKEIAEETGYADVRFVKELGRQVGHYYAAHKKENRTADAVGLLFDLVSDKQHKVQDDELKKHTPKWLTRDEVGKFLNISSQKYVWERYLSDIGTFSGEGVMVDDSEVPASPMKRSPMEASPTSPGAYGHLGNELEVVGYHGPYKGVRSEKFKKLIVVWLEKEGKGKPSINYKLRDWVFSRQHYWGEPIPVVHCEKDGVVPVPEDQLPVELPQVEKYQPSGTGKSPLDGIKEWVNVKCSTCGGPAKRETDTMPNWAGSSWYFLRYCDPHNDTMFADKKKLEYWMPVDLYNGGMEHTTLHLLYSRFWHKFLYDQKLVPTPEPYQKRVSHGMVLASDGRKMSKSFGNVVNPDELVEQYGADSVRLYEMFMGPFEDAIPWDTKGIVGVRRFLQRVWDARMRVKPLEMSRPRARLIHTLTKFVSNDIDNLKFNTCISYLMGHSNEWKQDDVPQEEYELFLKLLSPFAPFISEELWSALGHDTLIANEKWPVYDDKLIAKTEVKIAVQVNGKLRGILMMPAGSTQEDVDTAARKDMNVAKHVIGTPKKVVFVKDRLINFVV